MQIRTSVTAILAIALCSLTLMVFAQGPAGDTVTVTFDRAVQVGSHTLPPGEYTIRQVTSASNPRVLEFTTNHGTQLQATVTAIPIMQNSAPSETKIILDDDTANGTIRLSRIWVQGKNYGYEIPGNGAQSAQTTAAPLSLEARFDAPAAAPAVVAQNRPAETPAPEPAPAPTPSAVTTPTPEPTPNPEPAPAPQTPAPQPDTPASTNTPVTPANSDIPSTALGWAEFMFAGLTLGGLGLALYWRTASSVVKG